MCKILLVFLYLVSMNSLFAQSNKNGMDTLKQDIRNLGNMFKKAGTVRFIINNVDETNTDLSAFKKNIQQTLNVKKVENSYEGGNTVLKISFKGKASDLWNTLPANAKQAFTLNEMNDSIVNLNYRYAKTAQTTATTNNRSASNNNTTVKNSADSNTLSRQATLLFKNVKTKLSTSQKNKIADSLRFKLSKDGKQFISDDESADYAFDAIAYPTDINKDGKEDLFIVFGNSYTSGNTGSSVVLFIADKNGIYKTNLGFPGVVPDALTTANLGYPDLLIGGPGMEFPVWRWNGKEYDYFRTVKDADYGKLKTTSVEELSKAYVTTFTDK